MSENRHIPKLVQILSTPPGLFGLAEDGTVWVYCTTPVEGWKPVSMKAIVPHSTVRKITYSNQEDDF